MILRSMCGVAFTSRKYTLITFILNTELLLYLDILVSMASEIAVMDCIKIKYKCAKIIAYICAEESADQANVNKCIPLSLSLSLSRYN